LRLTIVQPLGANRCQIFGNFTIEQGDLVEKVTEGQWGKRDEPDCYLKFDRSSIDEKT